MDWKLHAGVGARPIRHAFSYSGSTMTDLGTLGGTNAYAYAINDTAGLIAGVSDTASDAAKHRSNTLAAHSPT